MIQSTIAQCFTRKTPPKTPENADPDSLLQAAKEDMHHASDFHGANIQSISAGNNTATNEPNQEDLHSYFDSIVSESNHLSLFKKMTEQSPSLVDMTLISSPATSTSINFTQNDYIDAATTQNDGNNSRNAKLSKLKMQWEETCLKWGFVVVRQLTYVQNTFSDILPTKTNPESPRILGSAKKEEIGNNVSGLSIIVNGQVALQEKDEIIVTHVIPNSPAHEAGMVEGDVIHAVYGMKDPTLSLLFGIMRDSSRFILTVKRMESSFDRSFRGKKGMISTTKKSIPSASTRHEGMERCECNEESSCGEAGKAGNSSFNRNGEEPIRFESVSETSIGDDSDYKELFGETVVDDVNNKEAVLDITPNISEINSSFPARDRRECQDNQFHASTALGKIARGEMNPDKQYVLQKPIAKNNQCMSKGKKEINSNIASAMATTNNDSNMDQDEINVENSFQPRDSMEIRSSANKHFRCDDQSIPSNVEPKTSNRNDSTSALSNLPKNSHATGSSVPIKVEEDSTNNVNTVNTGALDTLDPDLLESITHETNDISDEVLLSSLIEKSIENKVPNSSNVDQNSHKVSKKRKLSDIASISSKPIHADETKNQNNRLRNATSFPVERRSRRDTNNHEDVAKVDVVLSEERLGKKKNSSKKYSDDSARDGKGSTNQLVDRSNNDNTNFRKDHIFYRHATTETKNKIVGGVELPSKKHSGKNSLKKVAGDDYAPNGSFDDKSIHEKFESESEQGAIDDSNHREMTQYSVESSKGRHNSISSLDFSTAEDDNDLKMTRASPLTIPRPSPLTVSRQPSKVTVTSTSTKAGLGPVKSAKLKRLWPDSSVFSKRILKWGPPELVNYDFNIRFKGNVRSNTKNKLPVIPSSFRDASEMIKHMSPHILDEGLYSIQQEFLANSDRNGLWTRDVFSMKLRHCIPVDPRPISNCNPAVRTFEFSCTLDSNNGLQPPCNLGEMFVIHSPSWKQKCCLGIIGSNDINSTFLADQMIEDDDSLDLFKLWICVCSEPMEDSGWLYEADMPTKNPDGSFPPETLYMLNIGTCTDMMRQYEGLKSLACLKSNIKRAIYCSDIENIQCGEVLDELPSEPLTKPSCVCSTVWDHLRKTTNPFQLAAIEKIMSGKVKENIALLQGPPGTGKTSTTVALVSALLNGSVPLPGAKTGGTRVQVGRALQTSNDGVVKHNSSVARRILVCAPSNQAVDELAWKIHTQALGGNGKIGCFNIVRFGMLPGEDRHDGRGKRSSRRASSFYGNERDNFLSAINLDKMVRDVAAGKEIYDFRSSDPINNTKTSDNTRKSRYINFNVERQKILSRCHIVCTTLSGAGSKAFIESVSRDEYPHSEFDAVVIDEACQGSETSCLIPLKYNPNIIVLVGDPNQLPVMSLSPDASRCNSDRSLFERLHANGWPVNMLRIQYRMHPEIVKFPSKTFYNNNLITCDLIKNRKPSVWHNHLAFPPYLLWNIRDGVMARGPNGGISNNVEANFVVKLLASFSERYSDARNIEIGIISFYNDQVGRIKQKMKDRNLMRWMNSNNISLQVSTVDGFQGSEKDIIILSCVRSRWVGNNISSNIGFLKDFRRVNVALTRAKHSLWVVAHCEMLSRDPLWNQLIDDADKRNLIAETSDLDRFLGTNRQTHHDRRRKGGTNKKSRHSKENETKKRKGD